MNKKAITSGIIAAIIGFVFSWLVSYFLIPMPETILVNAFNNGLSGLISGFMGGYTAIKMTKK